MSLRFAVLGLLEDGPASGYALTARFEKSLQRFAWTARQSHIYPELARLAEDGLIEVAEEGARGRRTYAITASGRDALRGWLLSPPKPRAVRDEQILRLCLISALEPAEARAVVQSQLAEADELAVELRAMADLADTDRRHPRGRLRFGRLAIELGVRQAEAQREWAAWALDQLERA
ncbi:PadR family transcriptional regulator [Actinoplanes sp. L3-i22]|uniref:PadR family transcriptional regulator n=1 Tax=Actinoplanes sp. L3-i22 TaxID=2836373 RepID=UPI001C769F80|nr:PadR family transcriptional regulator [Actinoplanes sp. L3-i22]BCY10497.1 transcriptional regulator [Actinoplanes sp. L3-i22]